MASDMSPRIEDKEKFKNQYEACGVETRLLFDYIRVNAIKRCEDATFGYTNTKDFRLMYGYNFCLLHPLSKDKQIRVELRIHNYPHPKPKSFKFVEHGHSEQKDKDTGEKIPLLRFYISNREQLDEAVDVIHQVYIYHLAAFAESA